MSMQHEHEHSMSMGSNMPYAYVECSYTVPVQVGEKVLHGDIVLEGQELDPPFPLTVVVNKPVRGCVRAWVHGQ